jgi:uncharacterized oligopeptide transporter (OPT) family protein
MVDRPCSRGDCCCCWYVLPLFRSSPKLTFVKGMYNTPSFTLARTIGGLISLWWRRWKGRSETPIIVLASGLILGEGLFSIMNLVLASLKVPHL